MKRLYSVIIMAFIVLFMCGCNEKYEPNVDHEKMDSYIDEHRRTLVY